VEGAGAPDVLAAALVSPARKPARNSSILIS
jgi:hypothetical protein